MLLCRKLCTGFSIWGQQYYQLRKKCLQLWIVSKSSMMISWSNMMTIEVIQGCNGFTVLKALSYSCSILPLKKTHPPFWNLRFSSIFQWESSCIFNLCCTFYYYIYVVPSWQTIILNIIIVSVVLYQKIK